MTRRILLYSHDTFGFGNIQRNHAIARRLADGLEKSRVLVLTSSRWIHLLPAHPRIEIVKLPEVTRIDRGTYESRSAGMGIESVIHLRREIIRGASRGFRPDLFLVDKVPLGLRGELDVTLERLDRRNCRTVLMLRDILDEPEWTRRAWENAGQYKALARSYQEVWIFGDESVYPTGIHYALDAAAGLKVRYCGYLRPATPAGASRSLDAGGGVLVTVGGGEDGMWLLEAVAGTLRRIDRRQVPRMQVVLGPFLPPSRRGEFKREFARHADVRCFDYVSDLPNRIESADAVISMGGYNSVCALLAAKTPSLVVPRRGPGREQIIRCQHMSERGYFAAAAGAEVEERLEAFLRAPRQDRFPRPNLEGLEGAVELTREALQCA